MKKRKPYMFQGSRPSRWDLWKDGVSSSLILQWLACREQFRLSVVEGWRSRTPNLALTFGTLVHFCLQKLYAKPAPPTGKQIDAVIDQFLSMWKEEVDQPTQRSEEVLERCAGLALAVLPSYFDRWAGDFPGLKYPGKDPVYKRCPRKWVALEERFTVKIGEIPVRGTRDGVFLDAAGKERVFDTKCFSVVNEDDILDTLPTNLQQMLYLWSRKVETGKCPAGMMINVIRRPGHRQGTNETLKTFLSRVRADVSNPKRWDHFFQRYSMDVVPSELDDFETKVLTPILNDMVLWWLGVGEHYLNPSALVNKYGRCEMFNAIVFNRFDTYYRRRKGTILDYQAQVS